MEQLLEIIGLIQNETEKHANTKLRVATALRLLLNEIEGKVSTEDGKTLTSNDFTNELKVKLEGLQNADLTPYLQKGDYNGTAQELKTAIDNINKILTSDNANLDTLQEIVDFIEVNKSTLETLGIDNITGLRRELENKANKTHNHNDLYYGKNEVDTKVSAKAELAHTHNWTEITGKPDLLPEAPEDAKDYILNRGLWKAFNGIQWRELQNSERLNDIKETAILGVFNSTLVTEARDFPHNESRGGVVFSLPMTLVPSSLTVFHLFLSVGTQNGGDYLNDARIYLRSFVNNKDWLPWREFDGGKLHTVTDNTLNLGTDYKGFPVDNSTFILTKGTTITVPNNQVLRAKFIKNTTENITFNSTLPFVGEKVISSPVGSIIDMNANKTNVFINQGGSGEPIQITHKIGLWN